MATLNQIIAEQVKLVGEAKKTLEETQRKPPAASTAIPIKETTVAELKARVSGLTTAKAETARQLDEQIAAYQKEIALLEKQIEEEKKQQGAAPTPPPPSRGRTGGSRKSESE